jgi:hypothetical protein
MPDQAPEQEQAEVTNVPDERVEAIATSIAKRWAGLLARLAR